MSDNTSAAAYPSSGLRSSGMPGKYGEEQTPRATGATGATALPGGAPPSFDPRNLVTLSSMHQAPPPTGIANPNPATIPGGTGGGGGGSTTPDPAATAQSVMPGAGAGGHAQGPEWNQVDQFGNPTGLRMIGGQAYVRDGDWWVRKSIVDQYPGILGMQKGQNPQLDAIVEGNRMEYSKGVTTMATERGAAARAATTTATGYDSEVERRRRADAAASIGVDWKSDQNQNDPVFVARQVLAEELYNGGKYLLPGHPLAFAYHGGAGQGDAGWEFKDTRTGARVQPTPEQLALAKSIGDGGGAAAGGGGGGAQPSTNAVNVNGLPLAPGASYYGLPGSQVGWQTQAGTQSNYPYLARGAVAMPGSPKGVPVIMAEAGVPEVAIPVPKLRAAVGDDAAQRVIDAVSHTVISPNQKMNDGGVPKLAAGALTMGAEGQAGSAVPNFVPPPGMPGAAPTPPPSFLAPENPWGAGSSYVPFGGYTPATYTPYQERGMSDAEKAQLASISGIAQTLTGQGKNLYSIGAPAYADAIRYYQTLLGGNRAAMQAATAGSAEAIRAQGRGLEGRVSAQLGRSGAADAAKAGIAGEEAAAIARLTQGVQPAAAAALQSAGLEGAQAGAGMEAQGGDFYSRIQQALTQSRQFEENLGEQSRQFGASFEEQSRQFGTSLTENSRQFAASLAEQVRQGNMSYSQAMASLALNDHQFQQSFALQQRSFEESVRQFNESLKTQNTQIKAQKSSDKGKAIAGTIGTVAMVAVVL